MHFYDFTKKKKFRCLIQTVCTILIFVYVNNIPKFNKKTKCEINRCI